MGLCPAEGAHLHLLSLHSFGCICACFHGCNTWKFRLQTWTPLVRVLFCTHIVTTRGTFWTLISKIEWSSPHRPHQTAYIMKCEENIDAIWLRDSSTASEVVSTTQCFIHHFIFLYNHKPSYHFYIIKQYTILARLLYTQAVITPPFVILCCGIDWMKGIEWKKQISHNRAKSLPAMAGEVRCNRGGAKRR